MSTVPIIISCSSIPLKHGLKDCTNPSLGYKIPQGRKNYKSTGLDSEVRLWWLGPPFSGSAPPDAIRPSFSPARERELEAIALQIRAGLRSDESAPATTLVKEDTSVQVPVVVVATTTSSGPLPTTTCLTPTVVTSSLNTHAMDKEYVGKLVSEAFDKLVLERGDPLLDEETVVHAQVLNNLF